MSNKYINNFSYDNPQIIAGQGTLGLEILEQVDDIDAVVVPTGGGGLLAGVAVAIKTLQPNIKVIVSSCGALKGLIYFLYYRHLK